MPTGSGCPLLAFGTTFLTLPCTSGALTTWYVAPTIIPLKSRVARQIATAQSVGSCMPPFVRSLLTSPAGFSQIPVADTLHV